MYPNLEAELRRRKIRRVDLAHSLNLALSTVVEKLSGKSDISLSLALQIKQLLDVDIPLEILFKEVKEE
jgi:DNA-binding XRE family transcriptional regulator